MMHFHRWNIIPYRNQLIPVYQCRICGKKSWECRWFPDFSFRF